MSSGVKGHGKLRDLAANSGLQNQEWREEERYGKEGRVEIRRIRKWNVISLKVNVGAMVIRKSRMRMRLCGANYKIVYESWIFIQDLPQVTSLAYNIWF